MATSVYRSSEMVWLRLELRVLQARYTLRKGAIPVVILDDSNLEEFHEFLRRYPYRATRVLEDVRKAGFVCFMARLQDGVGGVMLLGTEDYHYQEPMLRVHINPGEVCVYGIWILPEHRKKMIAAVLVESALLEFRSRGFTWATGFTDRTNTASLGITERFGFQEKNFVRFHSILGRQLRPNRVSSCDR
jgi:GNAT superfamily N-acetyltransferase